MSAAVTQGAPFADMRGIEYVERDHPIGCGSKSRAIGKSGKRRELYPNPIPTLCDCGVREAARKKLEKLSMSASDLAGALEAALDEAGGFCNCPRKDLEIGGLGHGADCWTAVARKALRKAGVLP